MQQHPWPPTLPEFTGAELKLCEASKHVQGRPAGPVLQRWSTRGLKLKDGRKYCFPSIDNGEGVARTTCVAWCKAWDEWREQLRRAAEDRCRRLRDWMEEMTRA